MTIDRMANVNRLLIPLLCVLLVGCRSDNHAVATERIIASTQQGGRYQHLPPIQQALIGNWRSDVTATLELSQDAPRSWRDLIADDLEAYPIELRLSDVDYISRTTVKTVHDRYRVIRTDADTMEIELISGYGVEPRAITLGLRDGRLVIQVDDGRLVAFERVTQ